MGENTTNRIYKFFVTITLSSAKLKFWSQIATYIFHLIYGKQLKVER